MEISVTFHKEVQKLVKQFKEYSDYELEARYTGSGRTSTTKSEFDRCMEYCQSNNEFKPKVEESLDILLKDDKDNYRITILGKNDITQYCKTNTTPENVIVIIKTQAASPLEFTDIDFRINLKQEKVINEPDEIIDNLHIKNKSYRYKKRYSFINERDGYRIDLTVVKSSIGSFKNFVQSGITQKHEEYEIELELIARRDVKITTNLFLNELYNLYRIIADEDYVCSKNEKKTVIEEYIKLCYGSDVKDESMNPRKYFAGPQPVTLERKNIVEPGLGIVSIRENYTVTEKADGERCLLYVSSNGKCYFINSRLTIKYSGVEVDGKKYGKTLIDGESITSDIISNQIKHYAIFDCYWIGGNDIRSLPLIGSKLNRIAAIDGFLKIAENAFKKEEYSIYRKEFLYGGNIFEKAGEILKKNEMKKYLYHIDGLIFTPMLLGVGAIYPEQKIDRPVASWHMVFKWKPPEENTIDFLVKMKRGNSNNPEIRFNNNISYRVFDLYVGYDPASWDRITAKSFLQGSIDIIKNKTYVKTSFKPSDIIHDDFTSCLVPLKNNACYCTKNKDDMIEDDSIVEFQYDNTDDLPPFNLKWNPIRLRKDKTELYRKTKSVSNAVNDLASAMNIWRSIRHPVTQNMIIGSEKFDKYDEADDIYYDRKIKRDMFVSKHMMNFHNDIKLEIIKGRGTSACDLACGKAGDLGKFTSLGYDRVFGLDSSRDNIENPIDGAYARLNDKISKLPRGVKKPDHYAYLTYDLSQKINIDTINNADDKHVAQVLYGKIQDPKMIRYYKLASQGFDLVSCQFAIHYFFESERKLDNFLSNVDMNLKPGGYFIGTCLDGKKIKKEFGNNMQLTGEYNKNILWNLKRLYSKDIGVVYGEEIEVYMESIGRVMKEYLVNIDLLEKKLKALGYDLIECKNFKDYYTEEKANKYNLEEVQQKYSFMNMSFVFKKRGAAELIAPKRVLKKKILVDA